MLALIGSNILSVKFCMNVSLKRIFTVCIKYDGSSKQYITVYTKEENQLIVQHWSAYSICEITNGCFLHTPLYIYIIYDSLLKIIVCNKEENQLKARYSIEYSICEISNGFQKKP